MRSSSVTLRDVARAAGVHPGTASRALNAATRGLVNAETAERVIRAAEELGYRPNPIARGLKTNRSCTVGVLIPDLTNPLFPPIVRGIEDRWRGRLHVADREHRQRPRRASRPGSRRCAPARSTGFIIATARARPPAAGATARPGVGRWCWSTAGSRTATCPAVTADDASGVAAGGRAPRRARPPPHRPPRPARRTLSTGHQRDLGLPSPRCAAAGSRSTRAPRRFAQRVHRGGRARASAASCSTRRRTSPRSSRATTCSRSAATTCSPSAACAAPATSRVVGFNDMPFVDSFDPPLTTVRIPHHEIGSRPPPTCCSSAWASRSGARRRRSG